MPCRGAAALRPYLPATTVNGVLPVLRVAGKPAPTDNGKPRRWGGADHWGWFIAAMAPLLQWGTRRRPALGPKGQGRGVGSSRQRPLLRE